MLRQFLPGLILILPGLILISIFSCKNNVQTLGRNDKADTTLKILIYGLPNMEQRRAMNTVAKKYDFHYYAVAGCVVSEHLLDSVNKENKKTYELLEQKFGKNWRSIFAAEVDTMQNLQQQVEVLIKKESYLTDKENELKKEGDGLDYLIDPTDRQKIFAVKAYGWGQWKGKTELVIYYKLTVDLIKKTVVKNSDVVEKLDDQI